MMRAGSCDLQRPFDRLLPHNIRKIQTFRPLCLKLIRRFSRNRFFSKKMFRQLIDIPHGNDRKAAAHAGFRSVIFRNIQRFDAGISGRKRHRQDTGGRTQFSLQAQFANKAGVLWRLRQLFGCAQNADQDRQVINRSLFPQLAGSQIHRDPALRELEAAVLDGCSNTVASLFYRSIRQSHHIELGQASAQITLAQHRLSLNPHDSAGYWQPHGSLAFHFNNNKL